MLKMCVDLQEEIVDETDEYVDVHKRCAHVNEILSIVLVSVSSFLTILVASACKITMIITMFCRIRVAAAAAASSVARAPSHRQLNQKAAVSCCTFLLRYSLLSLPRSCFSEMIRT